MCFRNLVPASSGLCDIAGIWGWPNRRYRAGDGQCHLDGSIPGLAFRSGDIISAVRGRRDPLPSSTPIAGGTNMLVLWPCPGRRYSSSGRGHRPAVSVPLWIIAYTAGISCRSFSTTAEIVWLNSSRITTLDGRNTRAHSWLVKPGKAKRREASGLLGHEATYIILQNKIPQSSTAADGSLKPVSVVAASCPSAAGGGMADLPLRNVPRSIFSPAYLDYSATVLLWLGISCVHIVRQPLAPMASVGTFLRIYFDAGAYAFQSGCRS